MSRKKLYASDSERVSAHRQALVESGGASKTISLSPEAHTALRTLAAHRGKTQRAVIEELLIEAYDKLF